jgi:FecR protein
MPVPTQKPRVILDWFTVSYRNAVAIGVFLAVALVAAVWFAFVHVPSKPRREAQEAISRAEERLAEASKFPSEERLDEARSNAQSALNEGRGAFQRRQYDDARVAAIRSENLSQKAIDLAKGESTASKEVRISRIEGDVRVKRAGEFNWETADRKLLLRVGDQVKTAASGSVQLIYFDGTLTTINSGSLLEIREIHEDPATKVRHVSEKLNWGEVLASTQKSNVDGSFHEVATQNVSARSQEAGEFRVSSDKESNAAAVDVFQGKLQISSGGRVERLDSGERIRADAGGKLQSKEILPAVPRLISPADQKIFVHEDPAKAATTLAWEKTLGADRYHLIISDHLLFTAALYEADRAETAVQIDGIQPGEYYWKVACVGTSNVRGPYSPTRRFRVTTQALHDKEDTTPPILEITENVQSGPMLILNGKTEPGALLWVDNEKVDVTDDGSFYAVIRLRKEGVNDVLLQAQDASGNVRKLTHRAYVDPY